MAVLARAAGLLAVTGVVLLPACAGYTTASANDRGSRGTPTPSAFPATATDVPSTPPVLETTTNVGDCSDADCVLEVSGPVDIPLDEAVFHSGEIGGYAVVAVRRRTATPS